MTSTYEVEVTLGTYTFTVTSADTPAEDTVNVLDDLELEWHAPTSDPWPWQPEPVTLGIGFMTRDAANLAAVDIGTPMQIKVTSDAHPIAAFSGRVSDLKADPRRFGGDDVMFYDITGVDYTVDLAQTNITLVRPLETKAARLSALIAAVAAADGPTIEGFTSPPGSATIAPVTAYQTEALDELLEYTRQVPLNDLEDYSRTLMVPRTTAGDLEAINGAWPLARQALTWPPFGLTLDGSTLTIDTDAAMPGDLEGLPESLVIPASEVDLTSVSWYRSKVTSVDQVNVDGPAYAVRVTRSQVSTTEKP